MSLVIAAKQGNAVLFGASLRSCDSGNEPPENAFNAVKLESGVVIGFVAANDPMEEMLLSHTEWFADVPEKGLTRRHLIEDVFPKMFGCFKENEMIEFENGVPHVDLHLLIGYKDKLFKMNENFVFAEVKNYAMIGFGWPDCGYATAAMLHCDKNNVRAGIVKALRTEVKYYGHAVKDPFGLIDTEKLEFAVVQEFGPEEE